MKIYYVAFLEFDNPSIQTEEIELEDNEVVNKGTIKNALEKLEREEYYEFGSNIKQVISWSRVE